MSATDKIKPGTLCVNCGKHEATVKWFGGSLDVTHDWWQPWCQYCSLNTQLDYARGQAERIPDLERKLAVLDKNDPTSYIAIQIVPNEGQEIDVKIRDLMRDICALAREQLGDTATVKGLATLNSQFAKFFIVTGTESAE